MAGTKTIEQLEEEFRVANAERDRLLADKMRLEAELNTRKRQLAEELDQFRKEHPGIDPNNINEEIRRREEVVAVKLDVYKAEIAAAREAIDPILRETGLKDSK